MAQGGGGGGGRISDSIKGFLPAEEPSAYSKLPTAGSSMSQDCSIKDLTFTEKKAHVQRHCKGSFGRE